MSLVDLISETVYKYVTKSMKICIYMLKGSYLLKEHYETILLPLEENLSRSLLHSSESTDSDS